MTDIGDRVSSDIANGMYDRFRSYVTVEPGVCAFFERAFLERRGWRAVTLNEELSPTEANDLASACEAFGYGDALALDIDHFDPERIFRFRLGPQTLSMLEQTFFTPSYLVVEEKERFMLVSDSDYYWSIAGRPAFLERCFRKPLDVINREFIEATRNYRSGAVRVGPSLARIAAEATARPLTTS